MWRSLKLTRCLQKRFSRPEILLQKGVYTVIANLGPTRDSTPTSIEIGKNISATAFIEAVRHSLGLDTSTGVSVQCGIAGSESSLPHVSGC